MKISDVSIGLKLGIGFFALVLLTALLGAVSFFQLSRIHHNAQEIASNLLPSGGYTGELRVLMNRMRRSEAGMITARSTAEVRAFAEQMNALAKDLERVEAQYEPLVTAGEEREAFQTFRTRKAVYYKLQANLVDVAKAVDFSTNDTLALSADALSGLFAGESETAFVAAAETLSELQKINSAQADKEQAEVQPVFQAARVWVLGTLAACVALAVVLGVSITRLVTRPARKAVSAARAIAEGDLTAAMPAHGKDEMGQLLSALEDMRANLARVVTGVRGNA